jgi:hypothetical protein
MFFEAAVGKTALKGGGMANVIGSVGSLFYTQIKDTVIKKISVSELGLTQDLPADKLHIKLKVENQGNVASIIKGHYNLLGDNGKVVARGRFGLAYTFPGVKVEIGTVWSKALAPGRYDLLLTLDMEGKPVTEDYEVTVSGDRVTCKVEKAGR